MAFNVGVELGQLAVLAAAAALAWLATRPIAIERRPVAKRVAAYALGLPAGVWVVKRAAVWLASIA